MAIKFGETTIPNYYSVGLYNELGYNLSENHAVHVVDILFNAVTDALADCKNKDVPVAFVFEKPNGDFIAGAVVEYVKGEGKDKTGNWSYYWTWYKDDIPGNATIMRSNDVANAQYFRGVATSKYAMIFVNTEAIYGLMYYILHHISKWLDDNADENNEVAIEEPGVFQARVVVENGEKVKSLEVDGEIKKFIKDDTAIEA